jgi:hypothetical protein
VNHGAPRPTSRPIQAGYVLPETTALALIGCVDLVTTIALIATGQAGEANPLMANLLHGYGPGGLILGKVALLAGPLVVAELARKRNPAFVRAALRIGIVLYLTLYVVGFSRINPGG